MHFFASGVAGNKQFSGAVPTRSSKCVFVVLAFVILDKARGDYHDLAPAATLDSPVAREALVFDTDNIVSTTRQMVPEEGMGHGPRMIDVDRCCF
jgi:hypothetical protein